jgi:formyl-CoA transferase
MSLPLSGLLVVALEQAVAAPMCTCRLADAGARVIKIERPEGDFARGYDKLAKPHSDGRERRSKQEDARERAGVKQEDGRERPDVTQDARERADVKHEDGRERPDVGESAYFVWLNRGKQSLVLDLARDGDKAVLAAMLDRADVFVQNLKPGAIAKLGFPLDQLRRTHPRLVICSISGYGEDGPYAARKAYDMLIQAESGLASLTGSPAAPARVGVSVCDIAAGMNAYEAILEALIARGRTGDGAAISISMFDAMADWMAVPLLQYEGGQPPRRMGLAHTSIAPYGVFKTRDGADILISIQSDREWRVLAAQVLGDSALAADPAFATNVARVKRRADTDARVQAVFGATDVAALTQKLAAADIAFARVNDTADLAAHPQLRRIAVVTPSGAVSYPAPPARRDGAPRSYGAVPALGEHSAAIRAEFMGPAHE